MAQQFTLQNSPTSTKIFTGNPKCPVNVVIQFVSFTNQNLDNFLWICADKSRLDNATFVPTVDDVGHPDIALSDGVVVGDLFANQFAISDQIVLPGVRSDIYARAVIYGGVSLVFSPTDAITFNVESI